MKNLTEKKVEKCMQAIRIIRSLINQPSELGFVIRENCYQMIEAIDAMKRTGMHNHSLDLDSLRFRLDSICRLTNQFEAGGLIVEGNRAMDEAYKRLP